MGQSHARGLNEIKNVKVLCQWPAALADRLFPRDGNGQACPQPGQPQHTHLGNQLGSPEKSPSSRATASPPRFISVRCTQAMFFPGKEKGMCWSQQSWGPGCQGSISITKSVGPVSKFFSSLFPYPFPSQPQHGQLLHKTHKHVHTHTLHTTLCFLTEPETCPFSLVKMAQPNLWSSG